MPDEFPGAVASDVDFPSLEAAAGIHGRKHSPLLFLKMPKKSQTRLHSLGDSDKSTNDSSSPPGFGAKLSDHNLHMDVSHAEGCGQDGVIDMWTMLPAKENCSRPSETQPRRRSIDDDRTVVLHGSNSTGKRVTSMSMVLAEFLKADQVPVNDDESSAQRDDEHVDFAPSLFCTICGERTHTIRDCRQNLGALFCDTE
jgi:hypothetical protein